MILFMVYHREVVVMFEEIRMSNRADRKLSNSYLANKLDQQVSLQEIYICAKFDAADCPKINCKISNFGNSSRPTVFHILHTYM